MSRSGRRQGEDELREAAFRALIAARAADPAGGRLFFLAVRSAGNDRDPRPLLMTRFLDLVSDPSVAPDASEPQPVGVSEVSRARRAGGFVVEQGTGRLGTILRLSRITWDRKSPAATVHAQWFAHPNSRATVKLGLEREEAGRWVVRELIEKQVRKAARKTEGASAAREAARKS